MEELSKHPRLARRGQVYWFRAKVPADLRLHYAPKQEITFSLRTRDLKDALEKVRVEAVKLDQEFAVARRKQAEQPQTALSDIEIERLSAIYLQQLLQEDEEVRRDGTGGDAVYVAARDQLEGAAIAGFDEADLQSDVGMSEREYAKAGEALDIVGEEFRAALARGRTTIVEEEVDELLAWNGVRLDKLSESYRKLSSAILKASVTAHGMQARRHRGEVVDTPRAPAPCPARSLRRNDPRSSSCSWVPPYRSPPVPARPNDGRRKGQTSMRPALFFPTLPQRANSRAVTPRSTRNLCVPAGSACWRSCGSGAEVSFHFGARERVDRVDIVDQSPHHSE